MERRRVYIIISLFHGYQLAAICLLCFHSNSYFNPLYQRVITTTVFPVAIPQAVNMFYLYGLAFLVQVVSVGATIAAVVHLSKSSTMPEGSGVHRGGSSTSNDVTTHDITNRPTTRAEQARRTNRKIFLTNTMSFINAVLVGATFILEIENIHINMLKWVVIVILPLVSASFDPVVYVTCTPGVWECVRRP
eukprot:sb/3471111/